jgi:hypothetical protein
MLTYIGKGYSEAFIENYTTIIDRINNGENEILIVNGPDDICAPRLCDTNDVTCHCRDQKIEQDDLVALQDLKEIKELSHIDFGQKIKVTQTLVSEMRDLFLSAKIRGVCQNCEWHTLCTEISHNGYKEVKLK